MNEPAPAVRLVLPSAISCCGARPSRCAECLKSFSSTWDNPAASGVTLARNRFFSAEQNGLARRVDAPARLFLYFRSPSDQLPQLGCLLGEGNHQLGIIALGIEDLFEELIFRCDFTEHLLR